MLCMRLMELSYRRDKTTPRVLERDLKDGSILLSYLHKKGGGVDYDVTIYRKGSVKRTFSKDVLCIYRIDYFY